MAYVAIASDLNGYVFSIDHQGNLLLNKRGPAGPLAYPGLGATIGTGWDSVWCLAATRAAGRILLVGITDSYGLVSAQTPLASIDTWSGATPHDNGQTWPNLDSLMGGLDGTVFAVDDSGNLMSRQYRAGPDGTLAPGPSTTLSTSWQLHQSPSTNGVRFFDVTNDGQLQYLNTRVGDPGFPNGGWTTVGGGWTRYTNFFGAGPLELFTITSEGVMYLQRYSDDGRRVTLLPTGELDAMATGIAGWMGLDARVEGYCWPQTAAPGQFIAFSIAGRRSSPYVRMPVTCDVDFVRLRRMKGGTEANYDEVVAAGPQGLTVQPGGLPDNWLTGGAQWPVACRMAVDAAWRPGIYAARCTDQQRNAYYIPFVVTPAKKSASFAVLANTNTWCAYNSWGGKGKYVHSDPIPGVIPFDRPHPGLTPDPISDSDPTEITNQTHHLLRSELWILGWLEDLGPKYAYDMYTDFDLHNGIPGIGDGGPDRYKGLILTSHPEYWTTQEYDRVKAYQQQGGSIVYLGGNGIYEEVLIQDRSMVIFPGLDRSTFPDDASNEQLRVTCRLRMRGRPERAILGVGFENEKGVSTNGVPYLLAQAPGTNPVLNGVNLPVGAPLGVTSADPGHASDGWETDHRGDGSPPAAMAPGALIAARNGDLISGDMIFYETGTGGVVFSGSSLDLGGSLAVDPNLQRIVQNALDQCLAH